MCFLLLRLLADIFISSQKLTLGWSFSPFQGCCNKGLTVLKRTRQCKVFFFFCFVLEKCTGGISNGKKKKTYTLQRKRRYLSHMTSSGTAPQHLAHMQRELWLKRAGQVRRTRWPLGGIWEARAIGQNDLLCMWAGLTGRKRLMRTEYIPLRHGRKESFKKYDLFYFYCKCPCSIDFSILQHNQCPLQGTKMTTWVLGSYVLFIHSFIE